MRCFSRLATIVILLFGMPALAQTTPEGTRVRVAGTIEELKGDVLTVNAANGQKQSVTLSPDLQVYGVESRQVSDIKPVISSYRVGFAVPTARSTPSRCEFFRRHCAASATVSDPGALGPKA